MKVLHGTMGYQCICVLSSQLGMSVFIQLYLADAVTWSIGCWVVDEEHGGAFLTARRVARVGRCTTFDMAERLEAPSEIYLSRCIMAIYLFSTALLIGSDTRRRFF